MCLKRLVIIRLFKILYLTLWTKTFFPHFPFVIFFLLSLLRTMFCVNANMRDPIFPNDTVFPPIFVERNDLVTECVVRQVEGYIRLLGKQCQHLIRLLFHLLSSNPTFLSAFPSSSLSTSPSFSPPLCDHVWWLTCPSSLCHTPDLWLRTNNLPDLGRLSVH